MDTLAGLRVFCTIAELKSFTAAAQRLGISPAMASKHLAHLEGRLGARLLHRTSRRVTLTEAGALYYESVHATLEGLDEAETALGSVTVEPRGTLKLSAPMWAASAPIARVFAFYNQRFPEVNLDIDFTGRLVSLVYEGFDLALRATSSDRLDPGLVARPLTNVPFRLYASPSYLNRVGWPANLDQLDGHALLLYGGMTPGTVAPLPGLARRPAIRFRVVLRSENEIMLHHAALEGTGLAFLPTWMTQADVERGLLEAVLPGETGFSVPLHAVYPSRKYLSAKVRTFIDFLAEPGRLPGLD